MGAVNCCGGGVGVGGLVRRRPERVLGNERHSIFSEMSQCWKPGGF